MNKINVIVLLTIFILALVIRTEPLKYNQLDEFDPFWNYKATNYLVENGFDAYKNWIDYDSWFPIGRDVSYTSQEALHLTTAFLFNFYGGNLYYFTILIPAIFGSLSVFPLYYIVKKTTKSDTAGLITAGLFTFTFTILLRNSAGWFKSEPLGLLIGFTFTAIFVYLINQDKINFKSYILSAICGLLITFGLSAWVGTSTFVLALLLFSMILPAFAKETKGLGKILITIGIFTMPLMLLFERIESLFLPLAIGIIVLGVYVWQSHRVPKVMRILIPLAILFLGIFMVLSSDVSDRYKLIIMPFLSSDNTIVSSVAEHQLPSIARIVSVHGFYLFLAPVSLAMIFKSKISDLNKLLIFTLTGVLFYFGFSVARLELLVGICFTILSGIGLYLIYKDFEKKSRKIVTYFFVIVIAVSILPFAVLWTEMIDNPSTILVSGSKYGKVSNEWLIAMDFLSKQEKKPVLAWWDYGYWISALSGQPTYMDNGTLYDHRIEKFAKIFTMSPEDAHKELIDEGVGYVVFHSVSQKINGKYSYGLGGDELKSYWIFKIAGIEITDELFLDSFLGSLSPFIQEDDQLKLVPKYDGDSDLFQIVYVSPSYLNDEDGTRYGILIYKVLNS